MRCREKYDRFGRGLISVMVGVRRLMWFIDRAVAGQLSTAAQ